MNRFPFRCLLLPSLVFALTLPAAEPSTRWAMLNVTGAEGQADCHLLTFPDGRHVLIDAGEAWDAPGSAVAHLREQGVEEIALVVISHFHWDHYGQLRNILKAGIKVHRVVLNPPDKAAADREIPWGCDWNDVQALLRELRDAGIPYAVPQKDERIFESRAADGTVASLDVLCAYDGLNTPIGPTDVNDTSIVVRLAHGPTRVLFTGDLNHSLGAWLAGSGIDLRADILKAPHHGTEGTAPNEFYDRVQPRALLVPSPRPLWESARSMRTRNYFIERNVPAHVTGIHGTVVVTLTGAGYTIEKER